MTMLAPPLKTLLGTNMDWTHNITKLDQVQFFFFFFTPQFQIREKIKKRTDFKRK